MIYKIRFILFMLVIFPGILSCTQATLDNSTTSSFLSNPDLCETYAPLQKYFRFSEHDLSVVDQGDIVVKVLDTTPENEVVVFGIMRLNVSKEFFAKRFRELVTFEDNPNVQQIGKFSSPPRWEDIQELTLDTGDLKALKRCQPGKCKIKMDAQTMERFQEEVDWSAADSDEQATVLMQTHLLDYVHAYLQEGDEAMGEYHDKKPPLRIAEAFQEILENSAYLEEHVPELYAYLQEFPTGWLPNAENFVYWTKEVFGLRPLINVKHVTMYDRQEAEGSGLFITSKQIYASHYFETSLGFTAFIDNLNCDGAPASYLIYLNRSRIDQLKGGFKKLIVPIAKNQLYDGAKDNFQRLKERLEAEYHNNLVHAAYFR